MTGTGAQRDRLPPVTCTMYVPAATTRRYLPLASLSVEATACPVGVMTVICAATGFGGHGWSGVATGQLGPATTTPSIPPDAVGAAAPAVVGGCGGGEARVAVVVIVAVVEMSTLTGTITTTGEVASRVITGNGPADTDATGSVGVAIVSLSATELSFVGVDFATPDADAATGYEPCVADEPHPATMKKSDATISGWRFTNRVGISKPLDIDDLHACTGTSRPRPTATFRPQRTAPGWLRLVTRRKPIRSRPTSARDVTSR